MDLTSLGCPLLWWCQNADRQWREGREEKARLEAKADTLLKLKREQELKLKYASGSNLPQGPRDSLVYGVGCTRGPCVSVEK